MEHFEETAAWRDYRKGLDWQQRMGFDEKFPLYVRFKEGDQWPPATRRTQNLPRPVFNMVEMFIRTKRAAVLDQTISMTCSPVQCTAADRAVTEQGARDFTDYARQLWKRLGQDDLNTALVDDAATEGTGVLHYYWDPTVCGGGSQPYVGEVRGEALDPLSVLMADPCLQDLQKQEWVLISQRLKLEAARALAVEAGMAPAKARQLRPDASRELYPAARAQDGEQVTVLTRYFRKNGEVYFERCTRRMVLVAARPLTPAGAPAKMRHYPLVLLPWKPRKSCIFGIGEAESLLPSQKALNYNMAMMLLSVQQTGWPKLLVKPNALQQPVTNEPGELLVDYWQGGGSGIQYLQAPTFSSLAVGLSEKVLALARDINGVGQVTTGDTENLDLAASAIIALQNQARTPIREIQRRFWRTVEQVGTIWLEFFRCYCSTPRPVPAQSDYGAPRSFVGTDYAGMEYEMRVDVGASSEYSEVLSQATLDRMLDRGYLNIDQYVDLSGPNVVPFKERFKQMRQAAGQAGAAGPGGAAAGLGSGAAGLGSGAAGLGSGAAGLGSGAAGLSNTAGLGSAAGLGGAGPQGVSNAGLQNAQNAAAAV